MLDGGRMTLAATVESWLPAVGGIVGLITIVYFALMIHFTRKRDKHLEDIKVQLAELRGMILGKK